uniref:BHLH domain-containing protein n=1 Tax=Aegilops tauschii subsp. strangulata TaxID=200361 RepID=A0A453STG1_AEGTS
MGEGHGWRSVNNLRPPFEQNNPSISLPSTSTSTFSSPVNSFSSLLLSNHYPLPTTSTAPWNDSSNSNHAQQLQDPWNHLFMPTNGELANDEERHKNLEGQALFPATITGEGEEGDGSSAAGHIYNNTARHGSSPAGNEFQLAMSSPSPWSRGVQHYHNTLQHQASSITSTSSLGNNILDFSNNGSPRECTSTASGAAFKKARTQEPSPAQSTVKVRKEKLGDRITALHQLVSPFGKTDTASVLLEAIGYIRFLHGQIEVPLSLKNEPVTDR